MSTSVRRSTVWRGRRRPGCVSRVQYYCLTARPGPVNSHAGGSSMRRICFVLLLLSTGCIAGSAAMQREERLAKRPASPQMPKLAPAVLPVPRPFHDAAARLLHENPESARELDKLPPEDQTKIRAKLADLDREKEEEKHAAPGPMTAAGA